MADTMASGGGSPTRQPAGSEPTNRDIMLCLKGIEGRLSSMDKRLGALEELKLKVEGFERDMKRLWTKVEDRSKVTDDRVSRVEERVEGCDFSLAVATEKVNALEKEKDALKDNIAYLQSQSMRNNLVFTNIPESPADTIENCEDTVRAFIVDKLKVAQNIVDDIKFERVHRMGQKQRDRTRRIVARFHDYKDRELVRQNWKALAGTQFYVSEQFPKEVEEKTVEGESS